MKKGFTLIEIMVVIVILGILAAVGVPKLFGSIAKAKAAEIPVAAGEYVHLQEAFLGEKPGPGNWKDIGYVAPGNGTTSNFCYNQGNLSSAILVKEIQANTIGWAASNLSNLNECDAGSWWSIVITPKGDNDVTYEQNINSSGCAALTSNWKQGTTLTGSCASTSVAQDDSKPATPAPSEQPETPTEQKPADQPDNQQGSSSSSNPEESTPEQDYQACFDKCYAENLKAHGKNDNGAEHKCQNQCRK